jgi:hypothetical protein
MILLNLSTLLEPEGDTPDHQRPGRASNPSCQNVSWPMHAEIDPADDLPREPMVFVEIGRG